LRLVLCTEGIRTVTSLALTEPTELKQFWSVSSPQILRVAWCPDLCVLSVLYFKKEEPTKERTKVFLVDLYIGKKIVKCYKKVKPATVHLSPGRAKPKTKNYSEVRECDTTQMSTSFKIKKSLNHERFWRAMEVADDMQVREIFLGISPVGVRVMEPASLEPEIVIDNLHLVDIAFTSQFGNKLLKIKYLADKDNGKSKPKRKLFYVLPVTAQDIRNYHEQCTTLGEEADLISELPNFRVPNMGPDPKPENSAPPEKPRLRSKSLSQKQQQPSEKRQELIRGHSEGNIQKSSKIGNAPEEKKVRKNRKEREPSRRAREEDKENVEPKQNQRGETQAGKTEKRKKLLKQQSAADLKLRSEPLVPVAQANASHSVAHRVAHI